ncbi:La protein-like protein [Smittium culicis]|uniref:La protein-like protein n=1 Tax=Smittium culicis TaxID=133412 RepID=A0A1R1XDV9_9FUNG|nr:La protein-like protein [Smittium culicis]OMJ23870.1 La protein-like protein [Smittium culicis]
MSTSTETKIYEQVVHYFSDANLNWDSFMVGKLEQNDGWIELKVLVTFNKLKEALVAYAAEKGDEGENNESKLISILSEIIEKESALVPEDKMRLEMLKPIEEGSELGIKVKRSTKYVKTDEWFDKTLHLSFTNREAAKAASVNDEIKNTMMEYGKVTLIRPRKYFNKKAKSRSERFVPKGKFLVEFETVSDCEKAVESTSNSGKGIKINGSSVQVEKLCDYLAKKVQQGDFISEDLRKPGEKYKSFKETVDKKRNNRDSNKKQKKDEQKDSSEKSKESENSIDVDESSNNDNKRSLEDDISSFEQHVQGCLLGFKTDKPIEKFATIKKAFNEFERVQFVEINSDNVGGIIRFKEPVAVKVCDSVITANPETKAIDIEGISTQVFELSEEQVKEFSHRYSNDSKKKDRNGNSGNRFNGKSFGNNKRQRKF